MTIKDAREKIMKKFSNDRQRKAPNAKGGGSSSGPSDESLKLAASALCDFQSETNSKLLFKKKNEQAIASRADQILGVESKLPRVAAIQKAWKQLWAETDHNSWERDAKELAREDIIQYV
jgi:hypothetical protein